MRILVMSYSGGKWAEFLSGDEEDYRILITGGVRGRAYLRRIWSKEVYVAQDEAEAKEIEEYLRRELIWDDQTPTIHL